MPRPVDLRRAPHIVFRKLGRENAYGQARHPDFAVDERIENPLIEIDPRTKGMKRLEIAAHEALHIANPGATESAVKRGARYIALVLWHLGYRADDEEMLENFPEVK